MATNTAAITPRAVVNQAQTADEQLRLTRDYFDALVAGVAPGLSAAA